MIDEVLKINTVSQKHQGKTERKINIDQFNPYYRFFEQNPSGWCAILVSSAVANIFYV